jgi:hypothetical protein
MSTLILFFALTQSGSWEFFAMQRAGNMLYCEILQEEVARVYQGKVGNQRVVCTMGWEIGT